MEPNSSKPQPTPPPLPPPPAPSPIPAGASMAATMAEVEAAIAMLTGKRQRLREAYDSVVECSPFPIPFRWDDIDVHFSSILSSITARFRQLQPAAAAPGTAKVVAVPTTAGRVELTPVEHLVGDGQRKDGGNGEDDGGNGGDEGGPDMEEDMDIVESDEENGMVEEEASEARRRGLEDGEVEKNEKLGEPINASPEEEIIHVKDTNTKDAMEISPIPEFTEGGAAEASVRRSLAAACADMDSSSMARILCLSGSCILAGGHFLPALLGAAEPHALVVGSVRVLLAGTEPIRDSSWESCVALLDCVPKLAVALPADTLQQANCLGEDWKEMIGRTEYCSMNLGRLAVWGLFSFLVAYNIVLEFDAEEIIHFFGILPDDKKSSCISLCNYLGLIDKMADSVDHLIERGQQLVAVRLACTLNLTDKYPPLPIMEEYIQNAKETSQEILSHEGNSESLKQAMSKQVNALILSWRVVGECNIDSVHCDRIKAEITQLLHKYANKRHSLEGLFSDTSNPHQMHRQMSQEHHHWQHKRHEEQHQQLQNQFEEQEGRMQKLRERKRKRNKKTQRRKQKQKAEEMKQHRFNKWRKLYHGGSFTHSQSYVRPEIWHDLSQHLLGIIGPTGPSW